MSNQSSEAQRNDGEATERAYLESRGIPRSAPVRVKEEALIDLALERDRGQRDPGTRDGKRRARSGL